MYTKESRMPFGKYTNWKLAEVPLEYLFRLYFYGSINDLELFGYIKNRIRSLAIFEKKRLNLVKPAPLAYKQKACGKIPFRSERDAGEALHSIQKRSHASRIPKRYHRCKDCGFWHLTSMPFWKKQRETP